MAASQSLHAVSLPSGTMRTLSEFSPKTLPEGCSSSDELEQLEVYFESLPLDGGVLLDWRRRRFESAQPIQGTVPGTSMRAFAHRLDREIRRLILEDRPDMKGCRFLTGARFRGPTSSCRKRREITQSWHVDKEHFPADLWREGAGESFVQARLTEWHVVLVDRSSGRGTEFAADESGRILHGARLDEYSLKPSFQKIVTSPVARLHERTIGEIHRAPWGEDSRLSIVYMPVPSCVDTIP